jgi:branched-subunit amino acid ABC-type transport system permease component
MSDYLPFIVVGFVTGGVFCLASLGLVLTYRTSGVFNFAHGGIGMWGAYIFYSLRQHVPTGVAVVLTVFVVAPLMGVIIDRLLFRRLEGGGAATYVVASLGLLVALQSLAILIYGGETRVVDAIFPRDTYRLGGVSVGLDQTFVVLIAIASGLGLIVFFRFTQIGLRTRAVVSDRTLTSMTGVNASLVTTFSWMVGASFAALSGILFVPFLGLDALRLTLLVVASFGAAALGRLVSLPVAAVGAFGLAVVQSIIIKEVGEIDSSSLRASLSGLPSAVPFVGLLVPFLFARKGSLVEVTGAQRATSRRTGSAALRFPRWTLAGFVVVALAAPHLVTGYRVVTLTGVVAMVLLFISLSLLIGLSRQVSLAHSIFVVFGATTLAKLLEAGVPYLLALPLSALLFVPVGALIAIPAIRLSGLYLALATFAFALLAQDLLFTTGFAFGQEQLVNIPRPEFLTTDTSFYYFVLAITVVAVVAVELVRVSRLGLILTALADSPKAVQALGISPLVANVLTFCLSAFLAALAGGVLGSLVQVVSQDTYNAYTSLVWVTVLVAVGSRTLGGTLLAAALFVGVPGFIDSKHASPEYLALYLGIGAVFLAQTPNGIIGLLRVEKLKALAGRVRSSVGTFEPAPRREVQEVAVEPVGSREAIR